MKRSGLPQPKRRGNVWEGQCQLRESKKRKKGDVAMQGKSGGCKPAGGEEHSREGNRLLGPVLINPSKGT